MENAAAQDAETVGIDQRPALEVTDLTVTYSRTRGLLGREKQTLHAATEVSFSIFPGEVLGLVGESGSGKSTVAQAIERLIPLESGSIKVAGTEWTELSGTALRAERKAMQMVYQDPYSSLNPSMTVRQLLEEPLKVHGIQPADQWPSRVREMLGLVGLNDDALEKYPHEFSGGQRQRVAIARALITDPSVLILDEAVSALDVSTRGQILRLLQRLKQELSSAYLFIGHDLAVVRKVSDRIAVMYLGRIVELGGQDQVIHESRHPYTAVLVSAVPNPRAAVTSGGGRQDMVHGEPPDPWSPPVGCAFATRCPFAMEICREVKPDRYAIAGGGYSECHLHTEGPKLAGAPVIDLRDTEWDRTVGVQ
ncbi:ABC transporter ATP-binding protein [Cumulibacter soli]|uniref:ABC transporter ATP-binding protein n=1 Tax=Cumulibacter soli TaxID=2546344 RepID=UPI001ABA0D71|nr:oligopeptide/dipeptide ABC transporter ATP-binding protein [Cumulibacter soli]